MNASNITSGALSSDFMKIADGFITNAMIQSIAADKILSGSIYTNKVNVQSEDGGFNIIGNTAQWYDKNGKIRLQAGRDASDNFTFAVFGEDGSTAYFDQTGLKSAGVPNGIIVNDMVSDNANISAGKLDIASLFDKINEDGSHTINTSKIYFDDKGQSLEVYLASVETKVDDAKELANTAITKIGVEQGKISSLVERVSTVEDSAAKKVTNEYSLSDSETEFIAYPTGYVWSSTPPTHVDGKYMWMRTKTDYVNADIAPVYSDPVCISGSKGDDGKQGEDAVLLMIDSSNGNMFKNSKIATTLTVTQ